MSQADHDINKWHGEHGDHDHEDESDVDESSDFHIAGFFCDEAEYHLNGYSPQ